jgi:Phosphotransferase enzyme family
VGFDSTGALLQANGLAGVTEQPFTHTGFSGATLTRLVRNDGQAFVLKRMSIERDWIMRATDDASCREVAFAAAETDLGEGVRTPVVGAASDGEGFALLMRDIGSELLPPGMITAVQLELVIDRMSDLHRQPPPDGLPWCDLTRRLTLLTPATASIARDYGAPVARDIIEGWGLFDELASPDARRTVGALREDASPLVEALAGMPAAFLHGDLKLDNIGLDSAGRMWLIDWAMTLVAPPAVELGWFLAINSRRLPASLDEVIESYAAAARIVPALRAQHDGLTVLCGLLLRGWRKALDAAEGEPDELRWWCERVEEAAWLLYG